MSHVSAIILAMVSNVEDIGNSLIDLEFWQRAATAVIRAPSQTLGQPYPACGWQPV
jgi:hypothetical protein